ncbi:MAG: RNA pseudouridine synthase, partial [Paracoccaceae bacterium]
LYVNRLIRVSYGPFRLNEMQPGEVQEVRPKILRDQLGLDGPTEPTAAGPRKARTTGRTRAEAPAPRGGETRKAPTARPRDADERPAKPQGAARAGGRTFTARGEGKPVGRGARPALDARPLDAAKPGPRGARPPAAKAPEGGKPAPRGGKPAPSSGPRGGGRPAGAPRTPSGTPRKPRG